MKKWIVVRRIALAILLFYLVIGGLHTNGERFKLFPIMQVKAAGELNTNGVLGRLQELRKTTYPDGSYFEKEGFEGGYECFGFARKIQYLTFGVIPRWSYSGVPSANLIQVAQLGRGQYSAANMQNFISQAKPGDIIQAEAGPGESQHTMIFCWTNGNGTFTVWDANIISYNYISMREISYSRWAGKSWNVLTLLRSTNYPVIQRDSTSPTVSNVQVIENSSAGYTVSCEVTDSETGVARVQFPTWTAKDGQDDLIENWNTNPAASGWRNGNTYTFHVRDMDHRYERGIYYTDIYAFDVQGNVSDCISVSANVQNTNEYASTTSYKDHQYYLYNDLLSWNDAKAQCEKNGGHLATITSQEEQDVISSLLDHSERGGYFLGAYDNSENNGPYSWITGEPFSYSNWSPGEPNNSYGAEHYLEIYTNGRQWNDNSDNGHGQMDVGFILEKELSVQGITLSKANLSLSGIGVKYQLSANVVPDSALNKEMTWKSDKPSVVTVSGNGNLTTVSEGSANITVSAQNGTKTASCKVNVHSNSVVYNGHKYVLYDNSLLWDDAKTKCESMGGNLAVITSAGEQKAVEQLLKNAPREGYFLGGFDGTRKNNPYKWVTGEALSYTNWAPSEPNNADGIEHFMEIYTESGKWNDNSSDAHGAIDRGYVFEIKDVIPVQSVILSKENVNLSTIGSNTQLSATIIPGNAQNKSVTWNSSNPAVATVSVNGMVTAKSNGSTQITVTTVDGRKTALCKVIVNIPPARIKSVKIELNKKSLTIYKGKNYQLKASLTPKNSTDHITWSSSNKTKASISSNGKVTGKKAGDVKITATASSGKKVFCNIRIKEIKATSISINKKQLSLSAGKSYQLKVTLKPKNTTDTYSWSSSNKKIASVSKKGVVTAIKTGTVNITVKATNGKSVVCKVIVKPKTVAVKGITLNKAKISLKVGKTTTLSAIVSPGNATNKAIKWYSGNTSIVEVTGNGRIKAKRAGNTTITVQTGNNKKAICKVDVTKANSKINYKDVTVTSKLIDLPDSYYFYYYMLVTAKKADGSILWEYKTKEQMKAEIIAFRIMINKDKVYIFENGVLHQCDRITGQKIWSLKNLKIGFGGYIFDSQDNLYICGWYGNALTAIDKRGKMLWTIKDISDFYRAYKVELVSGNLVVTFEGGSSGGGKAYVTKQGRVLN